MTASRNGAGRQVRIRLTDVPLRIRQTRGRALYEAAVADRDLVLAAQLHHAIEHPSDRPYWLPEKAVQKVLRPRLR